MTSKIVEQAREVFLEDLDKATEQVLSNWEEHVKTIGIEKKGGPGSGHHGHSGRPGKRGGSLPGTGNGFVRVFHGTQDEFIQNIERIGIVKGKRRLFGRPRSVYFIESEEDALLTGKKMLVHSPLSKVSPKDFVEEMSVKNFAIVEVHVPRDIYEQNRQPDFEHDKDFGTTTAGFISMDFPPEWVNAVRIYGMKEANVEGYVVGYSEPSKLFEWERRKQEEEFVKTYVLFAIEDDSKIIEKQLPIDHESKQALIKLRTRIFYDISDGLADQLYTGDISIGQWQESMKQAIREAHSSNAAIGKGGWDLMEPADWGRLGPQMQNQYRYLQGFAEHIETNRDTVSLKHIKARAKLYGDSAAGSAVLMEAGVVFEAKLPYMPKDGSTECLNRCHCKWLHNQVGTDGDFKIIESTWVLGIADHCKTCLDRSGHVEVNRIHRVVDVPVSIGGY